MNDVAVIGGGIAGLGVAKALADAGVTSVLVLDQEKRPGLHASGRNAGMIRQAIAEPLIARLASEGRDALAHLMMAEYPGVDFRPIGSLLLASGPKKKEIETIEKALKKNKVASCRLDKKESTERVPVLRGAKFETALYCPSDGVLEIQALIRGLHRNLEKSGVTLRCGVRCDAIRRRASFYEITAGQKTYRAAKIINAAGAWANTVAEMAGTTALPLTAYRRHIYESAPWDLASPYWPFVWDLSHNFYFRPERDGLLMSPCDEEKYAVRLGTSVAPAEKATRAMAPVLLKKLTDFSSAFKTVRIRDEKAGLRTLSGDGRFIIGEDRKLKNFYWLAGLGGHGMTCGFATGRLLTAIILDQPRDQELTRAFSPARF